MPKINMVGPGYTGRSKNLNTARCINLYPEIDTSDAKNVTALIGTPGTKLFSNTGTDIIRGMHVFNDLIYFVSQSSLYSLDGGGTVTGPLGSTLTTIRGRVSMADNGLSPTGGDEIIVADGSNLYVWNVDTEAMTIVSIEADTVCFVSGRFVANSGGGKFRTSALYAGTSWNALDVATAESAPDALLAVFPNHGELWLIGEYTTEVWYKISTGNPPFDPVSGGVLDYGCAARFSIASGDDSLMWLGTKRNNDKGEIIGVCMARGYDIKVISPAAINYTISTYAVINDAFAYCYTEGGHEFYVLTFPSANATWVYDTTTQLWHERSSYQDEPYAVGRHLGNCYAYYNNRHYVGDYNNGNIYEMSSDVYDENGEPIVSQRIFPHLADKENLGNVFYQQLELDAEVGVGVELARLASYSFEEITVGDPKEMVIVEDHLWVTNYTQNTVSKINKENNQIEATISVGTGPLEILYHNDYIWVLNSITDDLSKIDPVLNIVVATVSTGKNIFDMAANGDNLWLPCYSTADVIKIDVTTNAVTATIPVGTNPYAILFADEYVWVINRGANNVSKINPTTNVVDATIATGNNQNTIIWGGSFVWVSGQSPYDIYKIDPKTDTVAATISPGGVLDHGRIIADDYHLWAVCTYPNTVKKINFSTDIIEATISMANTPRKLVWEGSAIWVCMNNAKLVKIDRATNTIVKTIDISGSGPYDMLANSEYLWMSFSSASMLNKAQISIEPSGVNPQAMLSWSDDGGHTWSNDYFASLGKMGEYSKRVQWRRLGKSRNRVFRLAIADSVKKVLISANLKYSGGA